MSMTQTQLLLELEPVVVVDVVDEVTGPGNGNQEA